MHEDISNVLVKGKDLSAGRVNPVRQPGGRCLQISPGPWRSRSAAPDKGKCYTSACMCLALILKKKKKERNDCSNERLQTERNKVVVMISGANSPLLRGKTGWRNVGALGACCKGHADTQVVRSMAEAVFVGFCMSHSYVLFPHKSMAVSLQEFSPFAPYASPFQWI